MFCLGLMLIIDIIVFILFFSHNAFVHCENTSLGDIFSGELTLLLSLLPPSSMGLVLKENNMFF